MSTVEMVRNEIAQLVPKPLYARINYSCMHIYWVDTGDYVCSIKLRDCFAEVYYHRPIKHESIGIVYYADPDLFKKVTEILSEVYNAIC